MKQNANIRFFRKRGMCVMRVWGVFSVGLTYTGAWQRWMAKGRSDR
jgi:hypothetical protein